MFKELLIEVLGTKKKNFCFRLTVQNRRYKLLVVLAGDGDTIGLC